MADTTVETPVANVSDEKVLTVEEMLTKAIETVMNEQEPQPPPSIADSSPFIVGAGVADISELPSLPNGTMDTPVCNSCEEPVSTVEPPPSDEDTEEEDESDLEEDEEIETKVIRFDNFFGT